MQNPEYLLMSYGMLKVQLNNCKLNLFQKRNKGEEISHLEEEIEQIMLKIKLIDSCLDVLTEQEREIVKRRYMQRETVQNISNDMGLTRRTIYVKCSYSLEKIQKAITRKEHT